MEVLIAGTARTIGSKTNALTILVNAGSLCLKKIELRSRKGQGFRSICFLPLTDKFA